MPGVYWLAVVLISVVGTLITDNLTDDLGVSLVVTTIVFSVVLAATFAVWYASERTLSIHTIFTTRREAFYWLTVLFTFALGTAAGDLTAERFSVGYWQSAVLFGGLDRRGLRRTRSVRAERRARVLACLHPDASTRSVHRRLSLPADRRRRSRPRDDGDERDLPRHHLRRGRLPFDHEARPDRIGVGAAAVDERDFGDPCPRRREQDRRDPGARRCGS